MIIWIHGWSIVRGTSTSVFLNVLVCRVNWIWVSTSHLICRMGRIYWGIRIIVRYHGTPYRSLMIRGINPTIWGTIPTKSRGINVNGLVDQCTIWWTCSGVLNPFNSTVGTKPTTEAQLDSTVFDGQMVLHIFRSGQFIDGIYVVIYKIYSYESDSFSLNVLIGRRPKRKERQFWERRNARGKRQLEVRIARRHAWNT